MGPEQPCPECGTTIAMSVLGASLVGICPGCQARLVLSLSNLDSAPDERPSLTNEHEVAAATDMKKQKRPRERYVACPECGKSISDDSDFCYHCGAEITAPSGLRQVHSPDRRRRPEKSPKSSGSAVSGTLMFVAGLILLITRSDLALRLVGREKALEDALLGRNSFQDTQTGLTIAAALFMLVGAGVLASVIFNKPRK